MAFAPSCPTPANRVPMMASHWRASICKPGAVDRLVRGEAHLLATARAGPLACGGLRRARNGADLAPRGSCAPATVANPLSRCSIPRSEEHTSELQSQSKLVCRLL